MTEMFTLTTKRLIAAPAERLFEAWTTPAMLRKWWGPKGVECSHAEVDLRVGGGWILDNKLPDGNVIRIRGEFLRIDRPRELAYTWVLGDNAPEHVTVRFESRGDGTEVVVEHERIASEAARDQHLAGWEGCLDGLVELFADL